MKFRRIMLIALVILTLLAISSVSAAEDNITDETGLEDMSDIEYNDSISEYCVDTDNEILLENTGEDNLSDDGEFIDVSEAYDYLNAFRTEDGIWYWNSDDTTKTYFNTNSTNQLGNLSEDSALVKTAQIRAKEIYQLFSHTRPDNTTCFTAYPEGYLALGENIAYGQTSCEEVTVAWEENDYMYAGQGHRRNMLSSNFNCVGIAGYKLNGVIYWVQAFGYNPNITTSDSDGENSTETNTTSSKTQVSIQIGSIVSSDSSITIPITVTADNDAVSGVNLSITVVGVNTTDSLESDDFEYVKSVAYETGFVNDPEIYTTNSAGNVHLTLSDLTTGTYYIKISVNDTGYEGDDIITKITFKKTTTTTTVKTKNTVKLTLNKVKVKKSAKKLVIKATLKINNKLTKGKKITFKFNGKTYKATTNKKGVAQITVKKAILKKLKVGKKITYTAKYSKATAKVTVKVKK